jgi:hypothetical protein
MLRSSIRDSASSAKAGHLAARRVRGAAIARQPLTQICAAMFFCALTTPFFAPLSID